MSDAYRPLRDDDPERADLPVLTDDTKQYIACELSHDLREGRADRVRWNNRCVAMLLNGVESAAADAAMWREIALHLVDYGQESVYVAQTDHGFAVVREYDGYPLTELQPTPEAALLAWWSQRNRKEGE